MSLFPIHFILPLKTRRTSKVPSSKAPFCFSPDVPHIFGWAASCRFATPDRKDVKVKSSLHSWKPEAISETWWQQMLELSCMQIQLNWGRMTSIRLLALSPWAMSFQVPKLLFRCKGNRFVPAMQLLLSANSQGLLMPPRTGALAQEVLPKTGDAPPLSRARRSPDLVPSRDASGHQRGHLGKCQTWGRHPCTGKWLPCACVPFQLRWSLWLSPCPSCH